MKWWLSKSAVQFREQVDDNFPDRDRRSDGTFGDARHALKPSSHNPDPKTGVVRGLDIDADLRLTKSISIDLAEQCRLFAKADPKKRIEYIIHNGKICSAKGNWKWRDYKGVNPHNHHIHFTFSPAGDQDSSFFDIPLLGGKI